MLSLLGSAVNSQQGSSHISYHTLNVPLHSLVKYKRSTILLINLSQYYRFASKHYYMCALESH